MLIFQDGRPEEYGIPANAIKEFEERLAKQRVRMHGYMMIAGKKVLAERYYVPYEKNSLHRMYSTTKSFVALAIGLLVKNNLVKLSDKICDYFPEKLPEDGAHPWCAEMTIEDMLTMRTCYQTTTYKVDKSEDWTSTFFKVKPDHVPGTLFCYDTSSSHVLAALVEKLTGMKVLDYMRKEMLDELGFSKEAYIIEDPVGVSQGGSGMMSTLRDVAGVAYLCNHYGMLDGKELLPPDYVRTAISNIVPTDIQTKLDEQLGYGYFIWMTREEGFVFYGMGGQLAVCFPKLDFIYMTMADTIGSPAGLQILFDSFYHTIYPYLKEQRETNPLAFENTLDGSCNADADILLKQDNSLKEMICATTNNQKYSFYPNKLEWSDVTFDWDKNEMHFSIPIEEFTLKFGIDERVQQPFLNTGFICECQGYWNRGHFFVECYMIDEEQGSVRMEFAWKDSRLSMHIVSTNDPFINDASLKSCFQGFASAECREMCLA